MKIKHKGKRPTTIAYVNLPDGSRRRFGAWKSAEAHAYGVFAQQ